MILNPNVVFPILDVLDLLLCFWFVEYSTCIQQIWRMYLNSLFTNQQLPAWARDAYTKESQHFWLEGETHLINIVKPASSTEMSNKHHYT